LVLAQDHENTSDLTCQSSRQTVADTEVKRQEARDFFMSELERLRNDAEVVDEIISIFQQELTGIDDVIRN